jgi:DNA-binding response OmpR family regulator
VVEDDLVLQELIAKVLAYSDVDVLTAADGRAGVTLAREERPNLILMDRMMPVLDGIAAIKELKADPATRSIPTIAMSAGRNLRVHADDLPADGVLAKPFDIDVLLALVEFETRPDVPLSGAE